MAQENIFDVSDPGTIDKLLKAAGTSGSPFVPGEARVTPYGLALEADFVPTPTTNLPQVVQLAASYGQSPHLYNLGSFLYPLGFVAGAGRGVMKAVRVNRSFSGYLDAFVLMCKDEISAADKKAEEGKIGKPQNEGERLQREYEEQQKVPGQMGGGSGLPTYEEIVLEVGAQRAAIKNLAFRSGVQDHLTLYQERTEGPTNGVFGIDNDNTPLYENPAAFCGT